MEDFWYKYIHKKLQFIATMNCRNNRSKDMKTTTSKTLTLCEYFTVNRSQNTKNPNLELEIEFAFPSMIYPSGKDINHKLHKDFLDLLPLLLKNLQHIQSKTNKKKLYVGNSTRRD